MALSDPSRKGNGCRSFALGVGRTTLCAQKARATATIAVRRRPGSDEGGYPSFLNPTHFDVQICRPIAPTIQALGRRGPYRALNNEMRSPFLGRNPCCYRPTIIREGPTFNVGWKWRRMETDERQRTFQSPPRSEIAMENIDRCPKPGRGSEN